MRTTKLKTTPYSPTAQTPLLERMGVRYFKLLSRGRVVQNRDGAVHLLSDEERVDLRRVHRNVVIRAAIAGAVSTLVSSTAESLVTPKDGQAGSAVLFWGVVGGATAVASLFEILFLYWDGLRSVHALSVAAGLDLFAGGESQAVAHAMARAALELPNPQGTLLGVDPHREASKTRLVIVSIVYKLKVSVTNFLVKMLVGQVLGRAMVRTWLVLPFVPVPLTALWDAIVCHIIMREARIRAMGSAAAVEMVETLFRMTPATSEEQELTTVRAVAATIVRTEDLHPNIVAVMEVVRREAGELEAYGDDDAPLDDTASFLRALAALPPGERPLVMRVLAVAAIVDGRMTGAEQRLWQQAQTAAGIVPDLVPLRALMKAFVHGDRVPEAVLRNLA